MAVKKYPNSNLFGVNSVKDILEGMGYVCELFGRLNGKSIRVSHSSNLGVSAVIRVVTGEGEHFKVTKEFVSSKTDFFIYVWNASEAPEYFILSIREIIDLAGPFVFRTKSWTRGGSYNWSSATGVPKNRKKILFEKHHERWEKLRLLIPEKTMSLKKLSM